MGQTNITLTKTDLTDYTSAMSEPLKYGALAAVGIPLAKNEQDGSHDRRIEANQILEMAARNGTHDPIVAVSPDTRLGVAVFPDKGQVAIFPVKPGADGTMQFDGNANNARVYQADRPPQAFGQGADQRVIGSDVYDITGQAGAKAVLDAAKNALGTYNASVSADVSMTPATPRQSVAAPAPGG